MVKKQHILLFFCCLISFNEIYAQTVIQRPWGGYVTFDSDSEGEETIINNLLEEVRQNEINFTQLNERPMISGRSDNLLGWPLKVNPSYTDYGYHGISFYVDLNPAYPLELNDYECSAQTYDTYDGYNHSGIDLLAWPFMWNLVEDDIVEVVAAAPGKIVNKTGHYPSKNCSFFPPAHLSVPNVIILKHFDGDHVFYTIYMHLKQNSLTEKEMGDFVEEGEFLGIMGSSGQSTGPHLHFEVRDSIPNSSNLKVVDPFQGACNPGTEEIAWSFQRPYVDAKVNKVSTHADTVQWGSCPDIDTPNFENNFCSNDKVWLYAFLRDHHISEPVFFKVFQPDGTQYTQMVKTINPTSGQYAILSYVKDHFILPSNPMIGTWTFEVSFDQINYTHEFQVCSSTSIDDDFVQQLNLSPNPATDHIQLTWEDLDTKDWASIQIVDINGRIIKTIDQQAWKGSNNITISTLDIPTGVYVCSILSQSNTVLGSKRFLQLYK